MEAEDLLVDDPRDAAYWGPADQPLGMLTDSSDESIDPGPYSSRKTGKVLLNIRCGIRAGFGGLARFLSVLRWSRETVVRPGFRAC